MQETLYLTINFKSTVKVIQTCIFYSNNNYDYKMNVIMLSFSQITCIYNCFNLTNNFNTRFTLSLLVVSSSKGKLSEDKSPGYVCFYFFAFLFCFFVGFLRVFFFFGLVFSSKTLLFEF